MTPRTLYRLTKHRPPRRQIYQPGFNRHNSCWLSGTWLTLPEKGWRKRKAQHLKLYAGLRDQLKTQHHRDKSTSVKRMTPAQRQAYEHYSGSVVVECLLNGLLEAARVECAGGKRVTERSVKWLRRAGYTVLRRYREDDKVINQARQLQMPSDLYTDAVAEDGEPFDKWKTVVAQNMQRFEDQFYAAFDGAAGEKPTPEGTLMDMNFQQLAGSMMFHYLLEQEETILRCDWRISRGQADEYCDVALERARYSRMRAKLETADNWREAYDAAKEAHNLEQREGLDDSDGQTVHFVLPEFNADGTHEAWGRHDVPWAV